MLEYLIQLPYEALGQKMLGFLELIDIIQWEKAAASQESHQLLRAILPYCPLIVVSDSWNRVQFNHIVCNWFSNRRCRVQFMRIPIESLCEVNFQHSVLNDITLCLKKTAASLKDIAILNDPNIREKITKLDIERDQNPAVMEVLFSLLTNSSVRSLGIQESHPLRWTEHIKKIGPCLHELVIGSSMMHYHLIKTITEYCPYLEKLSFRYRSDNSNILQRIASNCPHIHSIAIWLDYSSSAEADADLTAFAEKCPQLEELSLHCQQLTDQSVIALAQQCSRLKKLKSDRCKLTAASLIALSERGLPLEELVFPRIPIPNAEIAVECANGLSRIRELSTYNCNRRLERYFHAIPYMTGLRELYLDSREDHLLVPQLLVLLQRHCVNVDRIITAYGSSISTPQLMDLAARCPKLKTLVGVDSTNVSNTVLVELACSCPHLWKVTVYSSEVTEEGVLALAAHCRQLQDLHIPNTTLTEETVRQLAQHCRHLTRLRVNVNLAIGEEMVEHKKDYSSKEIRALRVIESSHADVITQSNTCCLIM